MPTNTCHFAGAQPAWHLSTSESKLRGMLNLGMLFNSCIYVNDIQLGDNPHFLTSFLNDGRDPRGLYGAMVEYARSGVLKVLLRDKIVLPNRRRRTASIERECEGVTDLVDAWGETGLLEAAVIQKPRDEVTPYLADVDEWVSGSIVQRYPWLDLRDAFRSELQDILFRGKHSRLQFELDSLPEPVREQYLEIVRTGEGTHGELHDLLISSGIKCDSPIVGITGLLNERVYARHSGSGLLGCDNGPWGLHDFERRPDATQGFRNSGSVMHKQDILQLASKVLDAPELQLIGVMTPEEVLELRAKGKNLFDLIRFEWEDFNDVARNQFRRNYVSALENYWGEICDTLRHKYPSLARTHNTLGIILSNRVPNCLRMPSGTISILLDNAIDLIPHEKLKNVTKDLCDFTFRLICFSDTEPMKKLARALPKKSWMLRQ